MPTGLYIELFEEWELRGRRSSLDQIHSESPGRVRLQASQGTRRCAPPAGVRSRRQLRHPARAARLSQADLRD